MLGLIGIKKIVDISIREKFSVIARRKDEKIEQLLNSFNEAILVSTCNRTEVYFHYDGKKDDDEIIDLIFNIMGWDKKLKKYIFFNKEEFVIKHLFELSCGFHSKIKGEDQILGQIKEAYMNSLEMKGANKILGRLFQGAIACGKRFRSEAKLYEIPVSSISIVVNKFLEENCKKIMVLGYGEIGKLAIKYLLQDDFTNIYLVLRDLSKADEITDSRVTKLTFNNKNKYINEVDGIIGCTSAPHAIVSEDDINDEGNPIYCFDMAIPRDIDEKVFNKDRVYLYNIDEISKIDDENKTLRVKRMEEYRWIINDAIDEFNDWVKIRQISNKIKIIKNNGASVYRKRINTYEHKRISENSKDRKLVETLIKSISDYYVNKAIKLLKEEKLNGNEEECFRLLSKIFEADL